MVRGTSSTSIGGAAKTRSFSDNGRRLILGKKSIGNSFKERLEHDKPNANDEILHLANLGK